MARVAASMSADISRLVARKLANRSAKSALFESRRTGMVAFRRVTAQWRGHKPPSTLELAPSVIPGWSQRVGALRRPMTGSGPDPESRDSGFALCAPRNDVSPPYSLQPPLKHPAPTVRRLRPDRWLQDRRRRDRSARIPGIRHRAATRRPG